MHLGRAFRQILQHGRRALDVEVGVVERLLDQRVPEEPLERLGDLGFDVLLLRHGVASCRLIQMLSTRSCLTLPPPAWFFIRTSIRRQPARASSYKRDL